MKKILDKFFETVNAYQITHPHAFVIICILLFFSLLQKGDFVFLALVVYLFSVDND